MSQEIQLVITDLDGTLLNSYGQVSAVNERAIRQAIAKGVPVVIATGKTRYSSQKIITRLGLNMPGVFVQGLVICAADGTVLQQRYLHMDIVEQVVPFCQEYGVDVFAYCHDRLVTWQDTPYRHKLHQHYDEPLADIIPNLSDWAEAGVSKLFVQQNGRIFSGPLRQQLAQLIGDRATLTQALTSSVEILPLGASKGAGVAWLLADLGIEPQRVMALGDAENDVEMLQLVGTGVAMGNAVTRLKVVADYVVGSNDEDGVAEAIGRFVL
jgi:Cof subfamily protein (haloacid dehalogenase superfamily)